MFFVVHFSRMPIVSLLVSLNVQLYSASAFEEPMEILQMFAFSVSMYVSVRERMRILVFMSLLYFCLIVVWNWRCCIFNLFSVYLPIFFSHFLCTSLNRITEHSVVFTLRFSNAHRQWMHNLKNCAFTSYRAICMNVYLVWVYVQSLAMIERQPRAISHAIAMSYIFTIVCRTLVRSLAWLQWH